MFKPKSERAPFEPTVEMMETQDEEGGPLVRWEHPKGFTLSWAAKDWGFGTLSFSKREEGGLYCGDEYMGLENATRMVNIYCKAAPEAEWPALLREYGGVERLLADVVDWESRRREPVTESSGSHNA